MARFSPALVPVAAAGAALFVGAIMILALGANPFEGYWELIKGAVGGKTEISNTVAKAVPLLLVGVGITVAFRASVINIGGEGQIIAGALAGTVTALAFPDWPTAILLPGVLIAGFVGGFIWGGVPGILKAYFGVNEILSTIMLNLVAVQLMNYALRGPLIDPLEAETTRIPQTERLSDAADLPVLVTNTRLNLGAVIAVLTAVAIYFLLWRTPFGYRIRAVGLNPNASRYAGIKVKRSIAAALAISGALCGLTGA
ncbi:MAG: ABC transporter permease, partial [Acidimicrobiia bacterium]